MKPDLPYRNRVEAGRYLAEELAQYQARPDVIVLGLTRGGVPVAAEVARTLQLPFDVVAVRQISSPLEPEIAVGAIAPDDTEVLDEALIHAFHVPLRDLDAGIAKARSELDRCEQLYRSGRAQPDLKDRIAILIDDGLSSGCTMLAAVAFARKRLAKRVILAAPIGSHEAIEKLRDKVDACICLARPEPFFAVREWYWNFPPVNDADVIHALEESRKPATVSARA